MVVTVTTVGANVLVIGAAVVTTAVTEEDGDAVGASEEIVVGDGGGVATAVAGTVGLGVGTSIIEVPRNVGVSDVTLAADGDGELVSCAIMIMLPLLLKVHNIKTSMRK